MTTQPEALRLADELEAVEGGWHIADACCAELRRLHELNEDLYQQGVGFIARIEKDEALLRQALEALVLNCGGNTEGKAVAAIAALRAALAEQPAEQTFAEYIETACALIKAADDAAADGDYMLDSDDCIKVLRGQWGAPLANDYPPKPQPAKPAEQEPEGSVCGRCGGLVFDPVLPQPAIPPGYRLVPVDALTRWRDAFAEELGAWDIDPPLHHVLTSHDEITALLASPEAPQPAKREPLTNGQRESVFRVANEAMDSDHNLSWRHAIVNAVEAAHGIGSGV